MLSPDMGWASVVLALSLLCLHTRANTPNLVLEYCISSGICDIELYKTPAYWPYLPSHGAPRPDGGHTRAPDYPAGLNEPHVIWLNSTNETKMDNRPRGTGNLLPYELNQTLWLNASCQQSPGALPYHRWNADHSNTPISRQVMNNGTCTVATTVDAGGGFMMQTTAVVPCGSSCICPPQYCLIYDPSKPSNFSCTSTTYQIGEESYFPLVNVSNGTHYNMIPSNVSQKRLVWGCQRPQPNPCALCDVDITTCAPHCVRTLKATEYFDMRTLGLGEHHFYKMDVMSHDNYCCKYLKHCERNHLFAKAESCNGFISMFMDIKPFPDPTKNLWTSAYHKRSGYVEKFNLPVYFKEYYITVMGNHQFPPAPAYNGTRGNQYTFFAASYAGNRVDNKQIVGNRGEIKLEGMSSPDPNLPDEKLMVLSFKGMSDPYGRPIKYYVYTIDGLSDPDEARGLDKILSSGCTMQRNGILKEVIDSKSFGLAEGSSEYEIEWDINQQMTYLLNIYAVNDVGVGQSYVTFQSALPPSMMDIISGDKIYYILGVVGFFIILVVLMTYFGKIRPNSQKAAKCKENEKQRLIEEAKNESEHDKIQRVRRENRQKMREKRAAELGEDLEEEK